MKYLKEYKYIKEDWDFEEDWDYEEEEECTMFSNEEKKLLIENGLVQKGKKFLLILNGFNVYVLKFGQYYKMEIYGSSKNNLICTRSIERFDKVISASGQLNMAKKKNIGLGGIINYLCKQMNKY